MATDRHQAQSYPLRMPEAMKEALQAAAERNSRSLHSELLVRLQRSVDGDQEAQQASYRLDDLRSELQLERGLAERFRIAANLADDFRMLVALLVLRVIDGATDGLGDFPIDPAMLRMLAVWLAEKDPRGAVHSIAHLLGSAPSEVRELLGDFSSFLEDIDLDRPVEVPLPAAVAPALVVRRKPEP